MKTTFKTMTNPKEAKKKRDWFREKTGLKWDCYHTGNGMRFTPIVTKETPTCERKGDQLLALLTNDYQEFVKLTTPTFPLADVLIAAKTLVKRGDAVGAVNRMGHFYAIRKKHSWEK